MQIQFKNKHIFFVMDSLWDDPGLDYRFKSHIHFLVKENSDLDHIQTVEIDLGTFVKCFKEITVQPEGVAASMNREMLQDLIPQIMHQSNHAEVLASQQARNVWQTEVFDVWHRDVYQPWLAEHPEVAHQICPDEPVPSTAPLVIEANEAAQLLHHVSLIDDSNKTKKLVKVENGKNKILA